MRRVLALILCICMVLISTCTTVSANDLSKTTEVAWKEALPYQERAFMRKHGDMYTITCGDASRKANNQVSSFECHIQTISL